MMELISSANDICIVFGMCACLGKINEIDMESQRNTASVVLTPRVSKNVTLFRPRLYAADNFSSCALIAEVNFLLSKGITFGEYLACIQREIDGRGKALATTETTNKKDVCRKSERKDRRRTCSTKFADHADILKIGELFQTRLARNSAGLLSIPCGKADRPTSVEGGRTLTKNKHSQETRKHRR